MDDAWDDVVHEAEQRVARLRDEYERAVAYAERMRITRALERRKAQRDDVRGYTEIRPEPE